MTKKVALIGYGYWGPNLLRNLFDTPDCIVAYCCDQDENKLNLINSRYPSVQTTKDVNDVLKDKTVDGIAIATPTKSHFFLIKAALQSNKDVLVEKPMTLTFKEAKKIAGIAKKKKRVLMVDHTFLFNDAVIKIKDIIDKGEIGNVLYIDSVRVNLGLFQKDSNVIFDLATHDFSITNYLLDSSPKSIFAHAETHFGRQEDVAYIHAEYPKKITVHVHISWLSPAKIRRMLIVGTKKMIVYDDIEPTEKIRVYDKGIIFQKDSKAVEQLKIGYRSGDIWLPKIDIVEPLGVLTNAFVKAIGTRNVEKSSGEFGANIVNILETATNSARTGRRISI